MKSITSRSLLRPFGWCVLLLLISTQSWGQTSSETTSDSTNAQQVEELRLLEEQNSVEQPRSAQQQNIDRFQRTFEEGPFGSAARRERIEEISRFHDERAPIPNYGRSGFLEAVRGDPPPPPPEEGSTSLVPYIPPETGTGIDVGGVNQEVTVNY